MLLSTKSNGSLTNPPAAAPMFAARDQLASVPLRLHIDSAPYDVSVEPWTTLLDTLRDRITLTGTKKGCNHGACGAFRAPRSDCRGRLLVTRCEGNLHRSVDAQ
jgi:hypothetical protein